MEPEKKPPDVALSTERVSCSCCGSDSAKRIFTERYELGSDNAELGVNRCRRCSFVYVSPRLTPEATRLVYELDAADTISHGYCWHGSLNEARFDALLGRLSKLANPGTLLDVGCGCGQFLRAAQRSGIWKVTGLEPMADAAERAERYARCEVRCSTLERADYPAGHFDVITLLGVLEHLHDPVGVLRRARGLMKRDGLLAVYVPNFNYLRLKDTGPICRWRTGRWSDLHPQEHLSQFTPRTLRRMLASCGFQVLRSDIGKPFVSRRRSAQNLKAAAYLAACALKASTGIHMGGLEVIARVDPEAPECQSKSGGALAA